jgi:2-(1,2-epoxy-1,2-dihydrophenyl)acetyl-CoA isomerase
MAKQGIQWQVAEGVGRITLDRPDVLNSFNREMAFSLQECLKECAENDAVRAVLLSGNGRGFCAGQDLKEVLPEEGEPPKNLSEIVAASYNPVILGIRNLEKPVVCAVNGIAAGAGANLAFACDFVLASEKASFVQSFCKLGLVPDSGGTFFLPRLVGMARATALTMLGEKLTAEQALNWGLIYRVCQADGLLEEATKLAVFLASQPTKGFGYTKRALNASLANDLASQLAVEEELQGAAGRTADYAEGVAAFLEKRAPNFTGK